MPNAVLQAEKCEPRRCANGRCLALRSCPVKAFYQEKPGVAPFLSAAACRGCSKCVEVCPTRAIRLN